MAIYVTGDTHGAQSPGICSAGGYMQRFSTASFPEQKEMGKDDYVIVCGDFGGVWSTDRFRARESPAEAAGLDWLEQKPFTTLFVPGNHENYDRLTGCSSERLLSSWFYAKMPPEEKEKLKCGYPRKEWHGGHVRVLRPSVLMLERGDIFDIGGKSFFAFGGARSHDIKDGLLDPADYPDEDAFMKQYRAWRGRMFRVKGISWWKEEMPSGEEMKHGLENLRAFRASHEKIDFIITHDAPASDRYLIGFGEIDMLNRYLESIRGQVKYGKWFYGHLHDNRQVSENSYLLFDQIVRIS